MKIEVKARGTDSAKVIQVIETQALAGCGTPESPARIQVQYWSFDGRLLGNADELERLQKENAKLKADLNETYTDESGTIWTRPTAWSYAQTCKANALLHRKIDEIECIKESEG